MLRSAPLCVTRTPRTARLARSVATAAAVAPRVAIVGGGLGGLTLARVLHVNGIPSSVYELDGAADTRGQGGLLDIHLETGQHALKLAGLFDGFSALVRPGGEAMRILDSSAAVRFEEDGEGSGDRPEIGRAALRTLLLNSLPPGTVRWGAKLASVRPSRSPAASGTGAAAHELAFVDGSVSSGWDVVVGADGAWSKVRPVLSDVKPEYDGTSMVELYLSDVDAKLPDIAALVGSGSMFALAEGKGIIAQRNDNAQIRVYATVLVPGDWASQEILRVKACSPAEARASLVRRFFADWSPALTALITHADDATYIVRGIHKLPEDHQWERKVCPGVTILGDAAHLTPPNGEGANLAMLDGAELALALVAYPGDVEGALAVFEAAMFQRSKESAGDTEVWKRLFSPGAPQSFMDWMASQG